MSSDTDTSECKTRPGDRLEFALLVSEPYSPSDQQNTLRRLQLKAFGKSGTENGGLELWHLMLTFLIGMTAESPCARRDNRAWIDLWRETGEFKEGHQVVLGCPEVLHPRRPSAYTAKHYIDRRLDDSAAMHWGVNLLGAAPPPAPVPIANNAFANNGFGEEEFGEFHDPIGEEEGEDVPQLEEGVEEGGGRMEELLRAAWRGEVDEVQRLVDQRREHGHTGVDPRGSRSDGPLLLAAYRGHGEVVSLLLGQGADLGRKGRQGDTPLICAVGRGHVTASKILLQHGADPCERNDLGGNALMYAACGGSLPVVQALLHDGRCGIDEVCSQGQSCLWSACYNGHAPVARLLLLQGRADPSVRDNEGRSAEDVARARGHSDCVQLLQWYEEECGRAWVLGKARRLLDAQQLLHHTPTSTSTSTSTPAASTSTSAAAASASTSTSSCTASVLALLPFDLRARYLAHIPLPRVTVCPPPVVCGVRKGWPRMAEAAGALRRTTATATRQAVCPSVSVLRGVLGCVLLEMGDDPFSELQHYMGPLPPLT